MPLYGCSSGLAVTALVTTLLLLPAQYYVPNLYQSPDPDITLKHHESIPSEILTSTLPLDLDIPRVDLVLTLSFIIIAMVIYLCDWIQRKLMEKRIIKLNQYLTERIEKLRVWDTRQELQEGTIRMVQNATSEYNLLLYLLLRQHKLSPAWKPPHGFDKELDELNITNPNDIQDYF